VKNEKLLEIISGKVLMGGFQIFEKLDFSWEKGQQWAIIGHSGKELTAFLETLRGITVVSSGEIHRHFAHRYSQDKNTNGKVHSYRDLMAYVSQKYELKNRSNQQNFYFQQRFNSSEAEATATVKEYLNQIDAKVEGPWTAEKATKILNLNHLLDQSLLKLSNGETRRLVLASGLMRQPVIYLMDHPMTGLDAKTRVAFGVILGEMIQAGIHVMLTTSPDEIPEGITHVAELNSTGIAQTWIRKDFPHQEHISNKPNWDWDLLKRLIREDPSENKSLIKLEDVSINYGEKQILHHLSWEVRSGERWLIKGPNGSGKSTLISLLIGENPQAYSQSIYLFDRKRGTGESIWDVKRPIGFMAPELSRYFPANQTCRKVILSGLFDTMGLFKKTSIEQDTKVESWLKLFDLEGVKDIPIQRLSLAQQRWAILARALIKEPKILILDEASQGLDDSQRALFKETIEKVCAYSSISLIYVSHYTADIPCQIDKVLDFES
jgi:ABC-type molybdenum transport system ATPase subunit/photorepair protein PhrA